MDLMERFLTFAEQSPTAFHAAAHLAEMLRDSGYEELKETDPWLVDAGGKYYVVRNDAAVIAFAVPETGFASFRIAAAHGDSPAFKLKENFEDRNDSYVRVNVEKYGGMIMSTWLDRPLSVAGRLAVREGDSVVSRLVNLDRDALLIPNMPIHFNRDVNTGYNFDAQKDMMALYGEGGAAGGLMREIAEAAGTEPENILGHDLFLYSRQSGSVWGADDAFFSCGRIDDLECAFAAVTAIMTKALSPLFVHHVDRISMLPVVCCRPKTYCKQLVIIKIIHNERLFPIYASCRRTRAVEVYSHLF